MAEDRDKPQNEPDQKGDIQGEGDKRSARRYNEEQREFVEGTDIDEKSRAAAPEDEDEEQELRRAEDEAGKRAKEHDPNEVRRKGPA
jgi:hypothetical protein